MTPETTQTPAAMEQRTVGWLARELGRSLQGVRVALKRLNITPSGRAAHMPLYPQEPTLSLLREGMRAANQKGETV